MTYELLKLAHLIGAVLMGGGLAAVFIADLRARQVDDLPRFAEAVRNIAVAYDGLVVPGAVLLAASGSWLIASVYGGWAFLGVPWLAGMVALFIFEFIEGNTVTRLHFMHLRRLSRAGLAAGAMTADLAAARARHMPTFTHFLDLPIYLVIVALGAVRPQDWATFFVAIAAAVGLAVALTLLLPRLYPWQPVRPMVPRAC
ncbi:MAG TPA: DUF2269 family protein [Alphaproteobacteria bacterium]|jgi:uncharacterized membrane protein